MIITLSLILLLIVTVFIYTQQGKFGKTAQGERFEKIKKSPHYKNGEFQNQNHTPNLTEGVSYYSLLKDFFSNRKRIKPFNRLPSQKTNLHELNPASNLLVWFGHSSYFLQIDGKKILVDPVLSGIASPIAFTVKAFEGTNPYTTDDIPPIDYLFISHDHWDHLDYQTLTKLQSKIKTVICGLGTGAHLEHWGYLKHNIIEKDWHEQISLDDGFTVNTVPARHFSGRGFKRNKSLWCSFVLQTPTMKIFIGGDSGYDTHFVEIGKTFGEFDLAILENGQYDKSWKYIHMTPEEVLQATKDLRAKKLLPIHSAKFALANHEWDAPLKSITTLHHHSNITLLTPMIGELVNLNENKPSFSKWWEGIQ